MTILDRTERASGSTGERLNKLRAGVMGANDGIVSVAATVIGVAAATDSMPVIATAGLAALSAGAFSMAAGEYISVSTQRDTEKAILSSDEQTAMLQTRLAEDLAERGVSADLAETAAQEMVDHDPATALAALASIDPDDLVNPWHAAWTSFFTFIAGAALPLLTILLFSQGSRIPATFVAVLVALALTGYVSARLGDADRRRAVLRTMAGGALAMAATYGIGSLFDVPV